MIELEATARDLIHETATEKTYDLAATLVAERLRLVRLCAHIIGDWDAAEDVAQETLLAAWRSRTKLRDANVAVWLNAIARHICLRWLRNRARDLGNLSYLRQDEICEMLGAAADDENILAPVENMSFALERDELAELLDRALALLPDETRALLIETYIRERPQSELAARWGMSAGALRVRLHRGRLALRRLLTTDLHGDALAAGILPPEQAKWSETRIWCPFCGKHRLSAQIDRATGDYSYRCAGNCQPGAVLVGVARDGRLVNELASPKAILTRHCLAAYSGYRDPLAGREAICATCGGQVTVGQWLPAPDGSAEAPPTPLFLLGVYVDCPTCGISSSASPWHLTLDTPQAVQFWRQHPRMRALPTHEVEYAGRPALVTGFESVETAARLEIVSARDTYEILRVTGDAHVIRASGESGKSREGRR